jgi:hypothetical protein
VKFTSFAPARATTVFDTFWRFAAERQEVFFRRFSGRAPPWTHDSILQRFKFTNAYRVSDRVSQYLIRNVIYGGDTFALKDIFFRVVMFKLFNKIETWERFKQKLGEPNWETYRYTDYNRVLTDAMRKSERIYSSAYIMASGKEMFGSVRKHQNHLRLVEMMMKEDVPDRLADTSSMRAGFELLRSYPLIGDFLGYQLITDLNYSEITNYSEMEFVVPGPGARDGIQKCFGSLGGLSEADIIKVVADRQDDEFRKRQIKFMSLWGRPLQLIDVQNLFCEVDKYARVKHPSVMGISGRTRIKQRFAPTSQSIDYFFPPKWNLLTRPVNRKSEIPMQQVLPLGEDNGT